MKSKLTLENSKIAVIGLGYVGLPLAVEFGKVNKVIGFDIDQNRINELINNTDVTFEVEKVELKAANLLSFTSNIENIAECNVYIVTVPTPIDDKNQPDLKQLLNATEIVGKVLKKDDVVIFESTVYPGCTEEDCVPILEKHSGLKFLDDFSCGYSPERINPGDKSHRITSIKKITSGSTPEIAEAIDKLYKKIILAGTYKVESIKIAEAAKIIENTQRDLNIALINEFAIIFDKMKIDTKSVLEAAETKWNFLPFRPGLVGGHCISVDPYYLTHKAQSIGYNPEVILAGRNLNDHMANYVSDKLVCFLNDKNIQTVGSKILVMGLAFKENCPDTRNTGIINVIRKLEQYECNVDVFDPWVNKKETFNEYSIKLVQKPKKNFYDAIVLCVRHQIFINMGANEIRKYGKTNNILYDLKYLFDQTETDLRI